MNKKAGFRAYILHSSPSASARLFRPLKLNRQTPADGVSGSIQTIGTNSVPSGRHGSANVSPMDKLLQHPAAKEVKAPRLLRTSAAILRFSAIFINNGIFEFHILCHTVFIKSKKEKKESGKDERKQKEEKKHQKKKDKKKENNKERQKRKAD